MTPSLKSQILASVPDKTECSMTITHKFKSDLIDFFAPLNLERCVEIGSWCGKTTRVLSYIFKEVYWVDMYPDLKEAAMKFNADRPNIIYKQMDAYNSKWDFPPTDMVFIDAVHTHEAVKSDIKNAIKILKPNSWVCADDIQIPDDRFGVNRAIDMAIVSGQIKEIKYVGERIICKPYGKEGFILGQGGYEGVICRI